MRVPILGAARGADRRLAGAERDPMGEWNEADDEGCPTVVGGCDELVDSDDDVSELVDEV